MIINEKTNCEKSNDAKDYTKAFSDYQEKHGAKEDAALQTVFNHPPLHCHAFLNNSDLKNLWFESSQNSGNSMLRFNKLFQCLTFATKASQENKSPLEGSNDQIVIRQHEKDFERLYFLAESVNTPFHELIQSFCGSSAPCEFVDSEYKQFLKAIIKVSAQVILGPIKSTQRAIEKVRSHCTSTQKFTTALDISML
jgi:hypothetical protein